MKHRKIFKNNYAVSHQLVSITSMSIFISVVLVAIINSVPLSPDTTVYSDTINKKSMALQTANMLIDTSGEAYDGSPCWESVTDNGLDTGNLLKPMSIGFKMNSYDSTSPNLRILSLKKMKAFFENYDTTHYEMLKTDVFKLPNYVDVFINIDFHLGTFGIPGDNYNYGPTLGSSKLLVTKSINALVYDSDTLSYDYATIQVKIT